MEAKKIKQALRRTGYLEAISWVVLLFIAMPLKYFWQEPMAVKIVGWCHGVLFMAYALLLLTCFFKFKWTIAKLFTGGFASVLPFGTLWFDKQIDK